MNFINKAVCITALFALGSASAKLKRTKATPVTRQAPAQNPGRVTPTRPAAAPALPARSYKQIHDIILNKSQSQVFVGSSLKDTFIQDTVKEAQAANIDADGIRFLLQTARDKFAPFTGNDADDLGILMNINRQIDAAIQNI